MLETLMDIVYTFSDIAINCPPHDETDCYDHNCGWWSPAGANSLTYCSVHTCRTAMAEKRRSTAPDFIPLSSTPAHTPTNKRMRKSAVRNSAYPPVYGDHNLIERIRDLVIKDTNPDPDQDRIMDQLQNLYPEYRRKKKNALRSSVEKALLVLDDFLDQIADESGVDNTLNESISQAYTKGESGTEVAVDEGRRKKKKNTNTASKSVTKQADLIERFLVTPKLKYSDMGAIDDAIGLINKLVFHIKHADLYEEVGIDAPKGFLIHGPHGVGKTAIVEAIATELEVPLLKCTSTELVTGISGESEAKMRELFSLAHSMGCCILFIDEIDAITPRRDQSSREMEKRMVAQLVTCIDSLDKNSKVIVIGATSRPDALDPALRRSGRFDREISLGIPDEAGRLDILTVITRNLKMSSDVNFEHLARNTPGYVGADLQSLIREAAIHCLEKRMNDTDKTSIRVEMHDFDEALKRIQPSAKREGFATVPDVTWNEIGALKDIRQELELSILAPIKYPKDVERLGLPTSVGLLLCGPPGCGKTLLAKAIANESGLNFISVKGPELLNMYVGESERAVRSVFQRARNSKPCVVFFDEIDALCRKRSDDAGSSAVSSSVVNQLLTEMDGLESRSCILLAATNRPDILDPAILRPGRFDKVVYVGFPTASEKFEILSTLTKDKTKPPCDSDVDLLAISKDPRTDLYSGADLLSLVREASTEALKDRVTGILAEDQAISVSSRHFEKALQRIKPSTSRSDGIKYEEMRKKFSSRNKK